ncbi:TetR/AcrR family transcriptional regulator [Actinoplanes sp. TBRC 11911]|uniref:TetR/AcrR family transcriptional regulator n=1 Tax=Actinoplanes sp. TBRC 11911 TaxID=2729386 RepID=UPI00145D3A39|nr:TetR/AcrR family transcriptional regulator [Actinoplanes sp. TBRC 11911]NMO52096.1 TetR/AcrR family transcriptional regulator [Actinoplanes sp. TBRC 11911]
MASVTRRPSTGIDRRAAVEEKIVEAAERLLRNGESFTELGVQRLAAEAGIARSTFYLHFRDKSELLLRLVKSLVDPLFDLLVDVSHPSKGLDGMVQGMILDVRYYRERRHLLAAVVEVAAYDPVIRAFWDGQLQRFIDRAEEWLRAEKAAGNAPADIDPATAARVMVWGGFQALANQVLTGPPEQDEVVAREIAKLEWYGAFRRPADA